MCVCVCVCVCVYWQNVRQWPGKPVLNLRSSHIKDSKCGT